MSDLQAAFVAIAVLILCVVILGIQVRLLEDRVTGGQAAMTRTITVEALTEALHHLHSVQLWVWWEQLPDGGVIVRKGTSPEFAAAIFAALPAEPAGAGEPRPRRPNPVAPSDY